MPQPPQKRPALPMFCSGRIWRRLLAGSYKGGMCLEQIPCISGEGRLQEGSRLCRPPLQVLGIGLLLHYAPHLPRSKGGRASGGQSIGWMKQ